MACCLKAKKFFDFLENIYNFFTRSSERYNILSEKLKLSSIDKDRVLIPKRVSTTRWFQAEAVHAVLKGFDTFKISILETSIYLFFWSDILERVQTTSLKLQSYNSDLNTSVILSKSLKFFV